MKKKVWIMILALALALCPALSACDNNTGATPDESASSETAGASSAALSAAAGASSKSAPSTTQGNAGDQKEQQAQKEQNAQQENAQNDQNAQQEQNDQQEQNEQKQEEKPASQKDDTQQEPQASSDASSSVAVPIYSDDQKPSFTIAVVNKKTQKAYSASCGYMQENKDAAGANFFLPGGEYHIAIYPYDNGKALGAPLLTKEHKLDYAKDENKTIRVIYTPKSKKIEVEEVKSDRNQ
ncbi:hypothetical protein [Ruminococcus sp.]|uniref:hypothetical protein n=1 Tax=Ruminococcus sp. TaxID=41978 RepID=UPI00388D2DDA